jgi:hypothetical protein
MKTFAGVVLFALVCVSLASTQGLAQEKGKRFEACKADIEKFCVDIPKGQHKIRPCLEANKDKISVECKTVLNTPHDGK